MSVTSRRLALPGLPLLLVLLLAAAARADVVHLKDGRTLEGSVVGRDATTLRLKTRLGEITLKLAEIERVEAGETREAELRRREGEAGADATKLFELAEWARAKKLGKEAERLYRRVVALAPEHAAAHERLGEVLHEGRWMEPAERERLLAAAEEAAMRAKGLVRHGTQWVTPADKARLEQGLVLFEGRWLAPDALKRAQGLELFEGAWLPRAESAARTRERAVEAESHRNLVCVVTPNALLAGPFPQGRLEAIGAGLALARTWFASTFGLPDGLEPFGGELPELYLWDDAGASYEQTVAHFAARTRYLPEGWIEAASTCDGFVYWDPSCVSSVRMGGRGEADLDGHCYHHWGHLLVNRTKHDGRLLPPWYDEAVACVVEHRVHAQNRVFCRALAGPGQGTSAKRAAYDLDPAELRRGAWERLLREALAAGRVPAFDLIARREFHELEPLDVLAGMGLVEWLAQLSPVALPEFHAVLRKRAPKPPERVVHESAARQALYDEAFRAACGLGWREADQAWRRWLASR